MKKCVGRITCAEFLEATATLVCFEKFMKAKFIVMRKSAIALYTVFHVRRKNNF